jgi:hypothetical protein
MAKIDNFIFGCITINGKDYQYDICINPDGVVYKRRSELSPNRHAISKREVIDALSPLTDVVVLGTGKIGGHVDVDAHIERLCKERNIKLEVVNTKRAVKLYNDFANNKGLRTLAILHITC